MLAALLSLLIGLLISDADAAALRSTAPDQLTLAVAREHLIAATVAGALYELPRERLLAITAHESNHEPGAITPEPPMNGRPRWSCGVMTPTPIYDYAECQRIASSTLAGYLAGAEHLADWTRMCRGNARCALRGYAGAWTVRDRCAGADQPRSCLAAWWFEARARAIGRALAGVRHRPSLGGSLTARTERPRASS